MQGLNIFFILVSFIGCPITLRGGGLSFYIIVIWNFEKRMDDIRGIRGIMMMQVITKE